MLGSYFYMIQTPTTKVEKYCFYDIRVCTCVHTHTHLHLHTNRNFMEGGEDGIHNFVSMCVRERLCIRNPSICAFLLKSEMGLR